MDDAALAAARELLVEVGYRGMSMDVVARRAGVSRAALYRRWPGKPYLVMDAAYSTVGPQTMPDTGSLEGDLLALLGSLTAEFAHPAATAAAAGLLADFGSDDAFRSQVRDRVLEPTAAAVRGLLSRAVNRGELAPDAPLGVIVDALGGTVFLRAVLLGTPLTPAEGRQLVQILLHGTAIGSTP